MYTVGVQKNSEKVFWEFDAKLEHVLPLLDTPTWPSHHVSEDQEPSKHVPPKGPLKIINPRGLLLEFYGNTTVKMKSLTSWRSTEAQNAAELLIISYLVRLF